MHAFTPVHDGGSLRGARGHGELGFADQHRSEFVHEASPVACGGIEMLFDGEHSVFKRESAGRSGPGSEASRVIWVDVDRRHGDPVGMPCPIGEEVPGALGVESDDAAQFKDDARTAARRGGHVGGGGGHIGLNAAFVLNIPARFVGLAFTTVETSV